MTTSVGIIMGILAVVGYLLAPVVLVWGWVRWIHQPKLRTISAVLSLLSFILASASALLAVSAAGYAQIHRFGYYDPSLMKIEAIGFLLSIGGFIFGVGGIWRSSSLRWHAPVSAVATLAFWLLAASME
jgi:4-amino-4-deoxy-L-arabinose transferase-like glycosyltransferase